MYNQLKKDQENIDNLLEKVRIHATEFLKNIDNIPCFPKSDNHYQPTRLNDEGLGAESTFEEFKQRFHNGIVSSGGSKYFGFVTGGTTPAALMGDWLVGTYDQNAIIKGDSSTSNIEDETINLIKELLGLPQNFIGTFVTGATMANFVGLAIGRQWVANEYGIDIANDGIYSLPPIKILSAAPHSSILKALNMLGMGRDGMKYLPSIADREAMDINVLENYLRELNGEPCIVVANAGTVNTGDFDDIKEIGSLKKKYRFYLHIDGAFGAFAACSPKYMMLTEGMDRADSITVDAHKWLNVPYDSAMQFTKHRNLQVQVFQNSAAYLGSQSDSPDYVDLTPENSRRLRALPAWFSLKAYGKHGYREIVERNCALAENLSKKLEHYEYFKLLSATRLNIVCFTIMSGDNLADPDQIQHFLDIVNNEGRAFFTKTMYKGIPGIRAAISNWMTEEKDIDTALEVLIHAYKEFIEQ